MDKYLIEYLSQSMLTIYAVVILLKACAAVSPWTWDNALVDAFDEIVSILLPRRSQPTRLISYEPDKQDSKP